jgi:type I restriction enzyme, R subunit
LPRREAGPKYDFDDEVALKYYRLQKISEGAIILQKGKGGQVPGPVSVGTGMEKDKNIELSQLIEILNERFGTDFKPGDQLFLDSIKEDALGSSTLREQAMANTEENFGYAFLRALDGIFVNRMEQNEDITVKFLNEPAFREAVGKYLLQQVYKQIRAEGVKL